MRRKIEMTSSFQWRYYFFKSIKGSRLLPGVQCSFPTGTLCALVSCDSIEMPCALQTSLFTINVAASHLKQFNGVRLLLHSPICKEEYFCKGWYLSILEQYSADSSGLTSVDHIIAKFEKAWPSIFYFSILMYLVCSLIKWKLFFHLLFFEMTGVLIHNFHLLKKLQNSKFLLHIYAF